MRGASAVGSAPSWPEFRRRRPLAVTIAITLATLTVTAMGAPAPADAAGPDCPGVAIFAFRGTDEPNVGVGVDGNHHYGGDLTTNGWEGERVSRILDSYSRIPAYGDGFRPDQVDVIGVGYDPVAKSGYRADGIQKNVDSNNRERIIGDVYDSSLTGQVAGLRSIADYLGERPLGCRTSVMMVGYSQGAMVTHTLASALEANTGGTLSPKAAFVYNLGDPYQKKNEPSTTGSGAGGTGFYRTGTTGSTASSLDSFYAISGGKRSLCHKGDPFCDYNWALVGFGAMIEPTEHLNYFLDTGERNTEARQLADAAHAAWLQSNETIPPVKRSAVDTVLAIDTTGSMSPYIAQAIDSARAIAEKTLASATTGRVGLVEYKDHGDSVVSRLVVPLTGDVAEFETGLDELYASGGGDYPEAVYSGIVRSLGVDWNPTAARSVVVLGDAPPQDPEPVTGLTAADIIAMLKGTQLVPDLDLPETGFRAVSPSETAMVEAQADAEPTAAGLPVTLYGLSASADLTAALTPIAEATGGSVTDLGSPAEVGDAIINSIEDSATAPEAIVSAVGAATAGIPLVISGVGSTSIDAKPSYDFDLDGDGAFELASAMGIVTHVFPAAGASTIGLRVTDSRGRAAIATAVVNVIDGKIEAPYLDPDDSDTAIEGVSVTPTSAKAGETVRVHVGNLPSGTQVAVRLVAPTTDSASPWVEEPVTVVGPLLADEVVEGIDLKLEAGLTAGNYSVLVVTESNLHGEVTLAVDAASTSTPTPTPTPTVSPTPAPTPAGNPTTDDSAGDSSGSNGELANSGLDNVPIWVATTLLLGGALVLLLSRLRARKR